MSDLVVIAFPTEAKAEEVRQKLLAMQKEYLLELGDAVVAVKDEKGHIKVTIPLMNFASESDRLCSRLEMGMYSILMEDSNRRSNGT